jgi:cellobiose phosphorylase
MNEVVPEARLPKMLSSVRKILYRKYGPILFYPAYTVVDIRIGYLTRYAPGVRENGGLYMHAGCWAVMAECKLKNNEKAWQLLKSMFPPDRGSRPDLYKVEPFVAPGNVDGPDSINYGRGGYTWYTGSATWLNKVCLEWILGVRPVKEGLLIDPCIPKKWKRFEVKRLFRGTTYKIEVDNKRGRGVGVREIRIDGKKFASNIIPAFKDKKIHRVKVVI